MNPRYRSPRIHDFESRAFSLSATHPTYISLHDNLCFYSEPVRATRANRPLALNWLIHSLNGFRRSSHCFDSSLSATHPIYTSFHNNFCFLSEPVRATRANRPLALNWLIHSLNGFRRSSHCFDSSLSATHPTYALNSFPY